MKRHIIAALVACGTLSSYGALTAHWDFNESAPANSREIYDNISGTTNKLWGGANNGLGVAGNLGDANGGLYFDGDDAHALVTQADAVAAGMNAANDFSIALWVNPLLGYTQKNVARFVDASANGLSDGGYRLQYTGGKLNFSANNGAAISGDTIESGVWNLLVLRYTAAGVATVNVLTAGDTVDAAFVAGNSATSASAAGDITYEAGRITKIGARNVNSDHDEFKGTMDDLQFFSGVLSDAEVAALYLAKRPMK